MRDVHICCALAFIVALVTFFFHGTSSSSSALSTHALSGAASSKLLRTRSARAPTRHIPMYLGATMEPFNLAQGMPPFGGSVRVKDTKIGQPIDGSRRPIMQVHVCTFVCMGVQVD